jgi:hypothetical protein
MSLLLRFLGGPRDRFAAEALRVIGRVPGVVGARYDPEQFAIAVQRQGHAKPAWLFLSNVYGECQGASRVERRERLERLARIGDGADEDQTWESVRDRLRPVLRPVTFAQVGVRGVVAPIRRPALPYLAEFVVVDHPESMSYVTPARLEEWKVTVEEVFRAARENLQVIAEPSLRAQSPARNTIVRMVDTGDGYFTSLLLAAGWVAGMASRLGSPILVFVPDTTTVMLVPVPDGEADGLFALAESEYREAVRSLSPAAYTCDEHGNVAPYALATGHPHHVAARRAQVLLALAEYGAQTHWLSKEYQEANFPVQVGALRAFEVPGGSPVTTATWTRATTILLPEADLISFVEDDVEHLRVPWQRVAQAVRLQPEPLLTPARYRVEDWPPPSIMDALANPLS